MTDHAHRELIDKLVSFVRWVHMDDTGQVDPESWLQPPNLKGLAEAFLSERAKRDP